MDIEIFPIADDVASSEDAATILKLAEYVARVGPEFEVKVMEKEASNPKFRFLKQTKLKLLYCWHVFCLRYHISEDVKKGLLIKHNLMMKMCSAGTLGLVREDLDYIQNALCSNTGSKDAIQALRRWSVERWHSSFAIGLEMWKYVESVLVFPQVLHTMYVINDILVNGTSATTKGIYTSAIDPSNYLPVNVLECLWKPIVNIMYRGQELAGSNTNERGKVLKLVGLWKAKKLVSEDKCQELENILNMSKTEFASSHLCITAHSVPVPAVASPYVTYSPVVPTPPPPLPIGQPAPPGQSSLISALHPYAAYPNPPNMPMGKPPLAQPTGPPPLPYCTLQQPQPPMMGMVPNTVMGNHAHMSLQQSSITNLLQKVDLQKVPVGSLANMTKTAKKIGHGKYSPLDIAIISQTAPAYVEPGRLDARVSDFYRKLQLVMEEFPDSPRSGKRTRMEEDAVTTIAPGLGNFDSAYIR